MKFFFWCSAVSAWKGNSFGVEKSASERWSGVPFLSRGGGVVLWWMWGSAHKVLCSVETFFCLTGCLPLPKTGSLPQPEKKKRDWLSV